MSLREQMVEGYVLKVMCVKYQVDKHGVMMAKW